MIIGTSGAATNEFGQVLLIQRNDTRTWAMPGGGLEAGELPTNGAAREVREETGIIVLPTRLVSLTFIPHKPEAMLMFGFRCIQRGGELSTSAESHQVGWFYINNLPQPMLSFHKQRLLTALYHQGGAPDLGIEQRSRRGRLGFGFFRRIVYPFWNWQRKRHGQPAFVPPPSWQIITTLILRNKEGQILWHRQKKDDTWHLPTIHAQDNEAPWLTAVATISKQTNSTIRLNHLSSVMLESKKQQFTLIFVAQTHRSATADWQINDWSYFAPNHEPPNANKTHLAQVVDSLQSGETTTFSKAHS